MRYTRHIDIKINIIIMNPNINSVRSYSVSLVEKAMDESRFFPVDREFVMQHLEEILSFDKKDFLLVNLEFESFSYVGQLMVCLPEVWEEISVNDLLVISASFGNAFAYYNLFKFCYKYIEVNVADVMMKAAYKSENVGLFIKALKESLRTVRTFVKNDGDLEDFEDGSLNIDLAVWLKIKEQLLIDKRVNPAGEDPVMLRGQIQNLIKNNL